MLFFCFDLYINCNVEFSFKLINYQKDKQEGIIKSGQVEKECGLRKKILYEVKKGSEYL